MPPDTAQAEAESLLDLRPVLAAQEALLQAEISAQESREDARQAERHHAAAKATFAELVAAAVAGRPVSRRDVIAVHAEAEAAERWATFASAVARVRMEPIEAAHQAIADAQHVAWGAVMERGISLRIAAAAQADRARLLGQVSEGTSDIARAMAQASAQKALAAAKPGWDRGTELVHLAVRSGHRWRWDMSLAMAQWDGRPPTEAYERRFWRKPLSEETRDAA